MINHHESYVEETHDPWIHNLILSEGHHVEFAWVSFQSYFNDHFSPTSMTIAVLLRWSFQSYFDDHFSPTSMTIAVLLRWSFQSYFDDHFSPTSMIISVLLRWPFQSYFDDFQKNQSHEIQLRNIFYKLKRGENEAILNSGPYAEGVRGVWSHPTGWANYFRIMQFFTRNCVYTPNLGLKIGIFWRFASPFVKLLKFTPPFSKVCIGACNWLFFLFEVLPCSSV